MSIFVQRSQLLAPLWFLSYSASAFTSTSSSARPATGERPPNSTGWKFVNSNWRDEVEKKRSSVANCLSRCSKNIKAIWRTCEPRSANSSRIITLHNYSLQCSQLSLCDSSIKSTQMLSWPSFHSSHTTSFRTWYRTIWVAMPRRIASVRHSSSFFCSLHSSSLLANA